MKRSVRDPRCQVRRFVCRCCGAVQYAPKARGKTGEGHVKHMWCPACCRRTEHEQKDYDFRPICAKK